MHARMGGSQYWLLIVDESTKYKCSYFLSSKDGSIHKIIMHIQDMNNTGTPVKSLICDNAGKNKTLKNAFLKSKIKSIKFKYTSPRTPQQNGVVERSFSFLYNRMREMLNQDGFEKQYRIKFWEECANTSTFLDNIVVRNDKSNFELFINKYPNHLFYLHSFGEISVIKIYTKMTSKLNNKGNVFIFLGYSLEHPIETYKFYYFDTRRTCLRRDIVWINMMYHQYNHVETQDRSMVQINIIFMRIIIYRQWLYI